MPFFLYLLNKFIYSNIESDYTYRVQTNLKVVAKFNSFVIKPPK